MGILGGLTACAGFPQLGQDRDGPHIAWEHLERREFALALTANDAYLQNPGVAHKDRILFQRGVIYCHPDNPAKDDALAIENFTRILKDYPNSDRVPETEVLLAGLQRIAAHQQAIVKLEADHQQVARRLTKEIAKNSDLGADIESLKKENIRLKDQVQQLKVQLEQLKDVDIGIEEKKREMIAE